MIATSSSDVKPSRRQTRDLQPGDEITRCIRALNQVKDKIIRPLDDQRAGLQSSRRPDRVPHPVAVDPNKAAELALKEVEAKKAAAEFADRLEALVN